VIVGASPVEYPRLAALLTAAFADNPVSDWLFDGAQDSAHPAFFLAFLRLAEAGGRIEQSLDGSAVAVWIDRTGTVPGADEAAGEAIEQALGAAYRGRWRALDGALQPAHPPRPHWSLAFLGTAPGRRGRQYGHHLLEHATSWLGGHPAHLEATSRRLTGYYGRYGFRPAGGAVTVPHGPTLHPMWRPGS
jgi:ribosomal protein S18 acetylase RimI-like enzyme